MSLSLIAWNPRIDEPSNPIPSLKRSSVSSLSGIEKCCQVPGRSVNLKSTTWTPASLALRITSAGDTPAPGLAPAVDVVGSNVAVMGSLFSSGLVRRGCARSLPGHTRPPLRPHRAGPRPAAAPLATHGVIAPPHPAAPGRHSRRQLRRRAPARVAPLQLAHVFGALFAGEVGARQLVFRRLTPDKRRTPPHS